MEDTGLELKLNLSLTEYEQQLSQADSETQKVMRKLQADLRSDKLKFDLEISNAKAAGDDLRAYQLELQKLGHTYKAQQAVVDGLRARLVELQKAHDTKGIAQVTAMLDKETIKLNKIQVQLNSMNSGFADKLLAGLGKLSPEFAQATAALSKYKTELESLTTLSTGAAAALGAIGGTVFAVSAVVGGLDMAHKAMDSVAVSAAEANEPIYLLAERFNLTYEEAEKLHGVMAIDGTNAEAFAKSLQRLNKELMSGGTGVATQMLKRYGVELRNADGTQKSYIEQTKLLSEAYLKAKEAGEGLNFVTATLGSGGSQFVHLLNGFDDYAKKYEEVAVKQKTDYQISHELLDSRKQLAEAERQLAKAKGEAYTPAILAANKEEIALMRERTRLTSENGEKMKQYKEDLTAVNVAAVQLSQGYGYLFDKLKEIGASAGAWVAHKLGLGEVSTEAKKTAETVKQMKIPPEVSQEQVKKQEDAAKRIREAYARIGRELRDLNANTYEKQLNRLKDEVDDNVKAGIDMETAWDVYYAKKDELDRRTAEEAQKRLEAETQKQQRLTEELEQKRKTAEESVSAVFQTETERRIAAIEKQRQAWIKAGADEVQATKAAQQQIKEARMSEAERQIRDYAKLAAFIDNEQKKGNANWRQAAEEYQRRQYMQGLGVNERQLQAVASVGPEVLRGITDSVRERTLAPITNNITVNFDNAIVEDVSTQNKLADMVADKILTVVREVNAGGAATW